MSASLHRSLQVLSPIVDEYIEWYGSLLRALYYFEEPPQTTLTFKVGDILDSWIERVRGEDILDNEALNKLSHVHSELRKSSSTMFSKTQKAQQKPSVQEFDHLSDVYERLINLLRRLEKDSVLEDSGIDVLTGLRSKHTVKQDLAREMERLARRGRSFCVAMARIDNYDKIVDEHGRDYARQITKKISLLIMKCMRAFDDAYRMGNGEFILSLKQAEISGGIAALDRLKDFLIKENVTYQLAGEVTALSMSCCVMEPLAGDDIDELLKNLRFDLNNTEKTKGSVLEYYEMSDLERFVQSTQ